MRLAIGLTAPRKVITRIAGLVSVAGREASPSPVEIWSSTYGRRRRPQGNLRSTSCAIIRQLFGTANRRFETHTAMLPAMGPRLVHRPCCHRIATSLLEHRIPETAPLSQFAHDHSIGPRGVHPPHAPEASWSEVVGITESTRVFVGIWHARRL